MKSSRRYDSTVAYSSDGVVLIPIPSHCPEVGGIDLISVELT